MTRTREGTSSIGLNLYNHHTLNKETFERKNKRLLSKYAFYSIEEFVENIQHSAC